MYWHRKQITWGYRKAAILGCSRMDKCDYCLHYNVFRTACSSFYYASRKQTSNISVPIAATVSASVPTAPTSSCLYQLARSCFGNFGMNWWIDDDVSICVTIWRWQTFNDDLHTIKRVHNNRPENKIYRFVRTSQETHYVCATSPTG
jgi:hypothetical protein